MERVSRNRAVAILLLFATVLGLFGFRMYGLQIRDADPNSSLESTYTTWSRVTAARGEILDRNGNVLVTNRASYNLVFNNYVIYNSDHPNEALRKLVNLLQEREISYLEHLPVTLEKPYEYTLSQLSSTWQGYFKDFLSYREWDSDISAAQLMKQLRSAYRIPNDWGDREVRLVVGLRYELELRSDLTSLPAYTLLEDVSSEDLSAILELNTPGLTVESSTVREYATTHAAHILGNLGLIEASQWPEYKDKGYSMDAYVGQSGFEAAFEEYLHGTDGVKLTTVDTEGNVVSEYFQTEPKAGANVETTIDLNMQIAAETALEQVILELREEGLGQKHEGQDAEGGAVVAIDVKTGQVLACASYPTYNPATYSQDFNQLLKTEWDPLYNRALQATSAPGSVFKMAVTIAAINDGEISSSTTIEDKGVYTKYEDEGYTPQCLIYTNYKQTHGVINVEEALAVSCNYFFYEAGIRTGMPDIDAVAKDLGLGEKTGIELAGEQAGVVAGPEYTASVGGTWYEGSVLSAAIGQENNRFTPLQLAHMVATLVGGGDRWQVHLLQKVAGEAPREKVRLGKVNLSPGNVAAIKEGMLAVTQSGSLAAAFQSLPVQVGAKTGSAQVDGEETSNAVLVCFAPYEDPEIALAVVVEQGGSGSSLGTVAAQVIQAYVQ